MSLLLDLFYVATLLLHDGFHRFFTGKYGPDVKEKRGLLPVSLAPRAEGGSVWIHAVSVGEVLAARPLIRSLREADPGLEIRISTTTATGREVAQKQFGSENVFYFPLDLTWMVRRAFDRVRPRLIILMELEVWPHFLSEASARRVPVVVSNVRITERSVKRFRFFGRWASAMLSRVTLWLSQNEAYATILRDLGVREEAIQIVGSLKYDGLDFRDDPEVCAAVKSELGGGKLLVAGSTHAGEEEVVYETFAALRQRFGPALRLVLVPRHPERVPAVAALAPAGMKVWKRSQGPAPADVDIVLGDLMGELSRLYRAADVVFIGGTLLERVGGHNMLEPLAFARPTVFGPHVANFAEPAAVLLAAGGALAIKECTGRALEEALLSLLQAPERSAAMGIRGREAARAMQGATIRSLAAILPLLSPQSSSD